MVRKGTHYPSRHRDPQWRYVGEHSTPTPSSYLDRFATLFEMKEYELEALQPEPRRVIHRYKTLPAAIADAQQINEMKDTQAIVIEYDGASDYVEPGYRHMHTVWREEKSEKSIAQSPLDGIIPPKKGRE
jgi:hypothetical protein